MKGDLGDFLAQGGAVLGGGAALGASLGFLIGSVALEFRADVEPEAWARSWGFYGSLVGLVVFLDGA
jgi:hypothetical protein